MSQELQPSGVDLARVALRAAKEAARKNGGRAQQPRPRTVQPVRRDGRDPMGLGDVLGALVTERAWELPAAGATLRERWSAIAPELAGHVAAVAFDADSGRLTVRPESAAWATKTRLEQTRVISAANKAAGRTIVRSLRILPPGAAPVPGPADVAPAAPASATSAGPVKTRGAACEGYRRAPGGPPRPVRRPGHCGGDRVADPRHAPAQPACLARGPFAAGRRGIHDTTCSVVKRETPDNYARPVGEAYTQALHLYSHTVVPYDRDIFENARSYPSFTAMTSEEARTWIADHTGPKGGRNYTRCQRCAPAL
ncbi:DciA family protein [Streptomyces netropsis]|uniref:Putative nucleic acid-binding Zn ribbon protein n=1 Tax=Streptomyces netropsis TaxID=55404 RepID=A0A7W7LHQ4_STRNE|nr:DciA family protein [Streptomyces netropsis]MBB4890440.1 putative nucleic acid-binding Zn ribbon protein [Streptomyces netropsis]GGR45898.1 hypothetical protein GCM10010219_59370 [Streptomyces netropsis]